MRSLGRFALLSGLFATVLLVLGPGDLGVASADHTNQLTITVETEPADGSGFGFTIDGPAGCDSSVTLSDAQSSVRTCTTAGTWQIAVSQAAGWVFDDASCSVPGNPSPVSDLDVSASEITNRKIEISISGNEHVECTFSFGHSTGSGVHLDPDNPLDPNGDGIIEFSAIAVAATPNVISCGGSTLLTATAREKDSGLIVPPELIAFHWSTDVGLLTMGPSNSAYGTSSTAILTLVPGMTSATVKAWVGDLSAAPGQVTVQQFCPGVSTDSSTAPGGIQLSASKQVVGCREGVFLGARVRDSKNQVIADGTVVNFMASDGVFSTNDGETSQFSAVTISGVLNIPYKAPNYGGFVSITAASGDKFSEMTLEVRCAAAPPAPVAVAGSGGAGGSSSAPSARSCIPIGDGVCITPPSTGDGRIHPPSTGDAGIR